VGGLDVEDDDHRLLEKGRFVYDACTPGASANCPPRHEQDRLPAEYYAARSAAARCQLPVILAR